MSGFCWGCRHQADSSLLPAVRGDRKESLSTEMRNPSDGGAVTRSNVGSRPRLLVDAHVLGEGMQTGAEACRQQPAATLAPDAACQQTRLHHTDSFARRLFPVSMWERSRKPSRLWQSRMQEGRRHACGNGQIGQGVLISVNAGGAQDVSASW